MYYSPSTNLFYDPGFSQSMPGDVVAITEDEHAALLSGQAAGLAIVADDAGRPVLKDRPPLPPPTPDESRRLRLNAYKAESDPLKIEAEYEAQVSGQPVDYTAWLAKVEEIKARYPFFSN